MVDLVKPIRAVDFIMGGYDLSYTGCDLFVGCKIKVLSLSIYIYIYIYIDSDNHLQPISNVKPVQRIKFNKIILNVSIFNMKYMES